MSQKQPSTFASRTVSEVPVHDGERQPQALLAEESHSQSVQLITADRRLIPANRQLI